VSALLGAQYTFDPGGVNAIVEYYRDGNGLSSTMWSRLLDGATAAAAASASTPAPSTAANTSTLNRPTRRDFLFIRGARANTDALLLPELIAIASLNDRGLTLVPTFRIQPTRHLQFYIRGLVLTGPARSADGSAPVASTLSAGLTMSF
jgi:hypothetical protein